MNRVEKIRERVAARKRTRHIPQSEGGKQPTLVHGGIYLLPNGEEVVCGAGYGSRYFFYHPLIWRGKAWVIGMPIAYEVMADGQVFTGRGVKTSWRIEDLTLSRIEQRSQAS